MVTVTAAPELASGPFPAAAPGRPSRTARRLALAMVVLTGLGLALGISGVTSVQGRAAQVDEVTTRSGPLLVESQSLYRYLSDADATVASAFLTDGPEPPELRERYQRDLADAGAALARISSGIERGPAAPAVATLSVQLPVYSGLVETARAFHRQGLPVGAAYLREASGVMRDRLLPAAEELLRAVSGELDDARAQAARFPGLAILLGLATLGFLVVFQVRLSRRTKRVLNVGLAVATVAALGSLLWLTASWGSAAGHLGASDREGSAQVALLSQARIAALQARSDEAHTLVARGAGDAYEESYQALMTELLDGDSSGGRSALLSQARERAPGPAEAGVIDEAIAAATDWQRIHSQVRELDDGGDHAAAVAQAIGTESDSAASAAARLDQALARAIDLGSERLTGSAARAGDALGGVGPGLVLLTVVLLIGGVLGIQQRLAEYR